ncbi:MAG: hypothetical protein ABR557_01995 [Pyrinomonadaceae bacterium]
MVQGRVPHGREGGLAASDPLTQSFAGLRLYYAKGNVIDMRETLQKFPVQLSSVDDYAEASL